MISLVDLHSALVLQAVGRGHSCPARYIFSLPQSMLPCADINGSVAANDVEAMQHARTNRMPRILQPQQQPARILDRLFHFDEEDDGFAAIDNAVVIAHRHIHHGANDDFTFHHHRAFLGFVHTQNT